MAESFTRAGAALANTSATPVYTAPSAAGDTAILLSCHVANIGSTSATISIEVSNAAGVKQTCLIYQASIPVNTAMEVIQNKVILNAGEKLVATADTADCFDLTVSSLEVTA